MTQKDGVKQEKYGFLSSRRRKTGYVDMSRVKTSVLTGWRRHLRSIVDGSGGGVCCRCGRSGVGVVVGGGGGGDGGGCGGGGGGGAGRGGGAGVVGVGVV